MARPAGRFVAPRFVVRYCVECGLSVDAPRAATKPPLCDPCKRTRWNGLARERYARGKHEHELTHRRR